MNYSQIPQPALAKLMTLEQQAAALVKRAEALPKLLDEARNRWRTSDDPRLDPKRQQAEIVAMVEEQKFLTVRVRAEQTVLSACKYWLDSSPPTRRWSR